MNNYWHDGRPTPLELVSNTWCPLKFMFKIPEHSRTFKDIFSVFPGQNIKEFKDIPGRNEKMNNFQENQGQSHLAKERFVNMYIVKK